MTVQNSIHTKPNIGHTGHHHAMKAFPTEDIFIYSIPIDPAEVRKTGCFTTLPVRIHGRGDLADAASHKLLKDWDRHIGDGQEKKSSYSLCELGNLSAFIYLEVFPERLGVLTYGTDLGLVHDGE